MTTAESAPDDRAVTIELTLDDVNAGSHTGGPTAQFRETRQYGRFECNDPTVDVDAGEWTSVADRLIASPAFDDGTFMWCDGYAEALLLLKVHRALGYTAYLMWDMAEKSPGELMGHVVLTSYSIFPPQ